MQDPVRVGPFAAKDHVWVVIETPAGSRTKYKWDDSARAYRAGRVLPLGMAFPFDFGFIPGTKAQDGDALDAYVERQGREYKRIGTAGSRKALQLVEDAKR